MAENNCKIARLVLVNSPKRVIIDLSDFHKVMFLRLYNRESTATRQRGSQVVVTLKRGSKPIPLASVIMSDNSKTIYDHIDRDYLNNRKNNLRPCSRSQNAANRVKKPGYTSIYKGVSRSSNSKRWIAAIRVKNKGIKLGSFMDEKEAALAYDKAAKEHFKEFAVLNF